MSNASKGQGGPRTMSAEHEMGLRGITAHESAHVRALLAELDAERAAHARTLEALDAVCDSEGGVIALREARALLAQARGEARP